MPAQALVPPPRRDHRNLFVSYVGLDGKQTRTLLSSAAGNVILAGQGTRHDQFEHDASLVEWLSEEDQEALRDMMASASTSMTDIAPLQAEIKQFKAQSRKTDEPEEK